MKVKLIQVVNSDDALSRLARERLPARMAFTIGSVIRALRPHMQQYEGTRLELCNRYGHIRPGTNNYEFGDKLEQFNAEMAQLLGTEIDLPEVREIPIDEHLDGAKLTTEDALKLAWLFTGEAAA